jgi:hypothetical protein
LCASADGAEKSSRVKYLPNRFYALVAIWVLITLSLHVVWEIFQLPFYTIWRGENPLPIVRAVLHCTLGDGLISAAIWFVVGALRRNWNWLIVDPWHCGTLAVALGLSYTAWSEWHNIHLIGSWRYADSMPIVAGIGLLPLLQWTLVPPLSWLLFRFIALHLSAPLK